ncbi:MAG: electron transfer flavoprotein subunit alpha/FixB family protein [Micrococcaceae bacterium]
MKTLVVIEDHINQNAAELLSFGAALGDVALYAPHCSSESKNSELVAEAGKYGASEVYDASAVSQQNILSDAFATSLGSLVQEQKFDTVLFTSCIANTEIAARLAVKLKVGILTQVTSLNKDGSTEHTPFAGRYTVTAHSKSDVKIIVAKKNSYAAVENPTEVERVTLGTAPVKNAETRIVAIEEKQPSDRPELTEADIVVAGGMGTNGDFSPLEDLADELGAAIGSTRAATDEGWIDHDTQVGQTGATVSPRLYISAGISGAIQQKSGMQTSENIVAINTDPDALVFEIADFGIVGDLHTVVPQITQELKKRKNS